MPDTPDAPHIRDTLASVVPLGTGPPTREELAAHYPGKFTWRELRTFINSGDLGLLKRDKKLQQRYNAWGKGIKAEYGSMVNYLKQHRLQWGKPDVLSVLTSVWKAPASVQALPSPSNGVHGQEYFTADTPAELVSVIQNDWPYSVPPEIEHWLIWTKLHIMHSDLIDPSIAPRVDQDGLWGFTGATSAPPSPSAVADSLPALAEWGVTMDKLVRSPRPSAEEQMHLERACREVDGYIRRLWVESEWETAWFVNPPRLQSVPGLAHIHVFARSKAAEEVARWRLDHPAY